MINRAVSLSRAVREPVMRPQTYALGGVLIVLIFVWL